jgi:hypothetical protein
MKEQIKNLIEQQKLARQEIFEQSNELSKINKSKLSKEDKRLLEDQLLLLEKEYQVRGWFINDLESFIF